MKESIQAAVSYVRFNAPLLGIIPPEFEKKIFMFMFLKGQLLKMVHQRELL